MIGAEIGCLRAVCLVERRSQDPPRPLACGRTAAPPWRTDHPCKRGRASALGLSSFTTCNGAGQIQIGRRIHLEQILVAQLVCLLLRSAGGQHDSSVLLGNDCRGRHQARGVRAEEELRFVLVDDAGVELLYARIRELVVVADEIDLVLLVAGLMPPLALTSSRHNSKPRICAVESLLSLPVRDTVKPMVRVSSAA